MKMRMEEVIMMYCLRKLITMLEKQKKKMG